MICSAGVYEATLPLVDSLLTSDESMVLADYTAYVMCQQRVSDAYRDSHRWTRMSILNTVGQAATTLVNPTLPLIEHDHSD